MKQKVEIEVEVPEGYEVTAEYRYPKAFELFINTEGEMVMSDVDYRRSKHIIVRKKAIHGQAWVDSLPDGTIFECLGFIFVKDDDEILAAGESGNMQVDKKWSDEKCRILYRPEENNE